MSNTKKTLRSNNTIGYKGVSKTKKKFKATITVDRKINYLGSFDTPKEAALAYDRAVTHHKLPAKKLNFPNGLPIDDDDYDALMNPTKKRKLQSDTTTGYIGIGVDNDTTTNSTNPNKKRKSSSRNTTGYRGVTKKGGGIKHNSILTAYRTTLVHTIHPKKQQWPTTVLSSNTNLHSPN
jgi:hypothetical protein